MKRPVFLIILLFYGQLLKAQGPIVPAELQFADIRLKINESARKEIQEDVDAIIQSSRYFNEKVIRAQLYFPIIERILAEERVPVDIKYLVIQESALIPDAVSSSKAVGFWQFKDFTAIEMGLRLDNHVDERMNIVSSTYAAAKYFKKNNFFFNNWLNALMAYQMGAGAALKVVDDKDRGSKSMTINSKTYWYVKKYLAHKIAYEYALMRQSEPDIQLMEYTRSEDKSLHNIATELHIDEEVLTAYNKWLKRGKVPGDKNYTVIVPVRTDARPLVAMATAKEEIDHDTKGTSNETESGPDYEGIEDPARFPEISENHGLFSKGSPFLNINGVPGIVGEASQTVSQLAELAEISEMKFRAYNEILPHETIREGQVYYFKKKKSKAKAHYHTIQYGQSLWDISQKYGVRMSKLLKKNRLKTPNEIEPGMVLWLRYVRPANEPVSYHEIQEPDLVSEKYNPKTTETGLQANDEYINMELNDSIPIVMESPPMVSTGAPDGEDDASIISGEGQIESSEKIKVLHQVVAKETLYAISKKYDVEVMDIVKWNDLNISEGIHAGQVLEIWATEDWQDRNLNKQMISEDQETSNEEYIEYRVKPGDTLYSIANRYGVTILEIQNWNNKTDNGVAIGEKIRIKK